MKNVIFGGKLKKNILVFKNIISRFVFRKHDHGPVMLIWESLRRVLFCCVIINIVVVPFLHLPIGLSIHPSIHLSILLFVYPSICLSVYLSICLSVYLSICLSVYLSIRLSIYLSIHLHYGFIILRVCSKLVYLPKLV